MNAHKKNTSKAVLCSIGFAFSLAGCLGGEEQPLEGERLDITTSNLIVTDEFAASGTVSIGSASDNSEWRQGAGNTANNPGNIAVGAETLIWSKELEVQSGQGWFGRGYVRTSARPLVVDNKIFLYTQNAEIIAYALDNGNELWSVSLRPEGEDGAGAGGGIVGDRGRIFAATGYGEIAALNADSGEIIWKIETEIPARNAPATSGGKVFIVLQSNEVLAVDQNSGTELWTFPGVPEAAGLLAESNPAVQGNSVVVPFTSGELMAIDSGSGEAIWVDAVSKPFKTLAVSGISDVAASPVISSDSVIATSVAGQTISLNLASGERDWERNIGGVHTPVVSGNAVFLIDLDDRLIALNRTTGKTFWVTQLPTDKSSSNRATWSGPLLGNGELMSISSEGELVKVNPKDGEIVSQTELVSETFVAPVAAGGFLVVLQSDEISVFQ